MNDLIKVLSIKPGEKPEEIEILNDLNAYQKAVGGLIQALYPYRDPVALICNDEAKLIGLDLNRSLRDEYGNIYDVVAGDFLVVGLGEDNFAGLSEDLMQKYKKIFAKPELFLEINGQLVVCPLAV